MRGAAELRRAFVGCAQGVVERLVVQEPDHLEPVFGATAEFPRDLRADLAGADDQRPLTDDEAAAQRCPRDRPGGEHEPDRKRPEERGQAHARLGDRGRVEHEHADPRGQRDEQDHARHVVRRRPHGLNLVVQVEAVALGEQHPGTEGGKPESQDDRISQGDVGAQHVDQGNRCQERHRVGEQQNTPQDPAAPPQPMAGEPRIRRLRGGLDRSHRVGEGLLPHVRQIARHGDLRAVQPRSRYPSDHHRPKEPSRSPTTSHPH